MPKAMTINSFNQFGSYSWGPISNIYKSLAELREDLHGRLSGIAVVDDIENGVRITYTQPTHSVYQEVTLT